MTLSTYLHAALQTTLHLARPWDPTDMEMLHLQAMQLIPHNHGVLRKGGREVKLPAVWICRAPWSSPAPRRPCGKRPSQVHGDWCRVSEAPSSLPEVSRRHREADRHLITTCKGAQCWQPGPHMPSSQPSTAGATSETAPCQHLESTDLVDPKVQVDSNDVA